MATHIIMYSYRKSYSIQWILNRHILHCKSGGKLRSTCTVCLLYEKGNIERKKKYPENEVSTS